MSNNLTLALLIQLSKDDSDVGAATEKKQRAPARASTGKSGTPKSMTKSVTKAVSKKPVFQKIVHPKKSADPAQCEDTLAAMVAVYHANEVFVCS